MLRQYGRYFIGDRYAEAFAQGLLALERNWRGPLAGERVGRRHARAVPGHGARRRPARLLNWRFQQALYRAYYDAYVAAGCCTRRRSRSARLQGLRVAKAGERGRRSADAAKILRRAPEKPSPRLAARVFELAEALFQSIRQQLSVARYRAIAVGRGANLDTIETPLNNRVWLRAQFADAAALDRKPDVSRRSTGSCRGPTRARADSTTTWATPPHQPHLVRGLPFERIPQRLSPA